MLGAIAGDVIGSVYEQRHVIELKGQYTYLARLD